MHPGLAIDDAVAGELVVRVFAEPTDHHDYLVFATQTVDTSTLQLFQPDRPTHLSFLAAGGKTVPLSGLVPL